MPTSREVGPFEVLERLGAGGMGVVYKARDRRLNRLVALKFLPEAASPAARERFQREALAIAALNHPNICTLHEAGEHAGQPYLVMELLEGETLHERLARGPLALPQLVAWGVEIADALQAAHAKGILHRDLKPGNIFITQRGSAKVLDFGLAQFALASASSADAATLAGGTEAAAAGGRPPLTHPGTALGTAAYMSPEQARGELLDARSDIFSLGVVLYEMAGGQAPFRGRTSADLSAAILTWTPPAPSTLRPEIPSRLDDIIAQCLEKEPELRFQSATDLHVALRRVVREMSGVSTPHPSSAPSASSAGAAPAGPGSAPPATSAVAASPAAPASRRGLWVGLAAAAVIAVAAVGWWRWHAGTTPPPQLQFRQLTFSGLVVDAVISPDGKFLAHVDVGPRGTSLHLLSISSGSDVEIMPPAPGCCQSPSFSPDGGQIYFLEAPALKSVPVLGGAVRTVAEHACSGAGFSPDGSQIAFVTQAAPVSSLTVAQPDGSQPRQVHQLPAGEGYLSQCWISTPQAPTHSPAWSPDGRWIAVAQFPVSGAGHISLVSPESGQSKTLGPGMQITAADLNWLPDSSGLVLTASIPETAASQVWEIANPSGRLTQLTNDLQGYAASSLSSSGQLAVVHGAPQASIWSQARPGGEFQPLPGGGTNQDGAAGLAWTADGGLVTFRNYGGKWQLWAENSDGSAAHAVLVDRMPQDPYDPHVAPNGQVVFGSNGLQANLWRVNADGSGLTELVHLAAGADAYSPSLVRNGTEVSYMAVDAGGSQYLATVPLAGGTPRQAWSGFIFVGSGAASPDGNQVMVISRVAARALPLVVVLHLGSEPPQVTPLALDRKMAGPFGWTADGKAIIYRAHLGSTDNLWALPVAGGAAYALTHFNDLNIASYAVARDGRLALSRGSRNQDAVIASGLLGKGRQP